MEVTKFEIRKDGDSHIASFTVRLNTDTDKFNDKMEEILDRTRKKLEDMHKINPGDYFIARKPNHNDGLFRWCDKMDKYDGVIQECQDTAHNGSLLAGNEDCGYAIDWCEKVSPGDVMKTGLGDLIIFKEFKAGRLYASAFYSHKTGEIFTNPDVPIFNPLQLHISHTTPEEARPLFDALAKCGKKWNKEKLQVEDIVWKPKAGDVCANKYGSIFIYKRKCFYDIEVYAALYNNVFYVDRVAFNKGVRLATYEERCVFFERLVKEGYKWNAKKLKLTKVETKPNEEITRERINFCNGVKISCDTSFSQDFSSLLGIEKWTPKEGEFVAHKDGWIHIHKDIDENMHVKHYVALSPIGNVYYKYSTQFVGVESDLRGPATESECQKLIEALKKEGKQWNVEKMCVEDLPKFRFIPKASFQEQGSLSATDVLRDFHTRGADESLERQIKTLFGSFADNSPTTYSLSSEELEAIKKVIKTCKELLNSKKITL